MNNIPEYVEQAAQLINLPIPPEYQAGVIANFERIATITELVTEFPLPDDLENAPVFNPELPQPDS